MVAFTIVVIILDSIVIVKNHWLVSTKLLYYTNSIERSSMVMGWYAVLAVVFASSSDFRIANKR